MRVGDGDGGVGLGACGWMDRLVGKGGRGSGSLMFSGTFNVCILDF